MKSPPTFVVADALEAGALVNLSGEERRHARARRLRVGSAVRLIDGSGRAAAAVVERLGRGEIAVRIEAVDEIMASPDVSVVLLAPALRFSRLSWLIEKAAELGATRILLVATTRTQGDRLELAGRDMDRLRRIAQEAAKQSGSRTIPSIEGPVSFASAAAIAGDARLFLDPEGDAFPVSLSGGSVALWIGPEGGFSEEEKLAAEAAGWSKARLPGGILRAETAVLASLALASRAIDSTGGRADNTSNR